MEHSSRSQHCCKKASGRLCIIVVENSGTSRQDSIPICRNISPMASDTEMVGDEASEEVEPVEVEDGMRSSKFSLPSRVTSWWLAMRTLPAQSQMSIQSSLHVQIQWLLES